jgi:hypothetical protein
VPDQTLVDELLHDPELILARDLGIDPVQLPQVDAVQAEAAHRHQHALPEVLGVTQG